MPIAKKVYSHGSGLWIQCSWFECQKDGYELYKTIFHEHARSVPCNSSMAEHVNFVFCSERHKQYFLNSHLSMGNLPKGYAKSL